MPVAGRITNRRQFLHSTAASTLSMATVSAVSSPGWASTDSGRGPLRLGFIGVGGRGTALLKGFMARRDCQAVLLCDPNRQRLAHARKLAAADQDTAPHVTTKLDDVLGDDAIDAVVIATPDHWHAPASIYACQAGKHVYVEKPVCNQVWEGRRAVEAARKYDRVVQSGMQTRSAPYALAAREYIRSGKLGDIVMCRVYNQKPRRPLIEASPDSSPPDYLDWDLWNGPCTNTQFNPTRFRHWHDFWDYGGGEVSNDGVHQLDLACMVLDIEALPRSVYTFGSQRKGSAGETPDTVVATFGFADVAYPMIFQQTLEGDYMLKTDATVRDSDMIPYWQQNSTRVEIFGTQGVMFLGRHGGGWQVFARPQSRQPVVVAQHYGRFPDPEHKQDFLSAIRESRAPNADIEHGFRSAALCHLANISYRAGNVQLNVDPKSADVTNHSQAQALLRGEYRQPYTVPEEV